MSSIGFVELVGLLCLGVFAILGLALLALLFRFLNRNREKPAGTYNHPDIHSGGSIGGMRGGRAYDDPKVESGATIGGDPDRRAHDHPKIRSGGSIGGGPSAGQSPGRGRSSGTTSSTSDSGWSAKEESDSYRTTDNKGRKDSPDIKSGGSFGG